jgi:hypothetical protein
LARGFDDTNVDTVESVKNPRTTGKNELSSTYENPLNLPSYAPSMVLSTLIEARSALSMDGLYHISRNGTADVIKSDGDA